MPDFEFLNIGKESVWIVKIFVIVLAALLLDFFQRKVGYVQKSGN